MTCQNCNKNTLDSSIKNITTCDFELDTASTPVAGLNDKEGKLSRRVESNRAMAVSSNGKSIIAVVDKLICYTECMVKNILVHLIDNDSRIKNLENIVLGTSNPTRQVVVQLGYMYSQTLTRVGNVVTLSGGSTPQGATRAGSGDWTSLPETIPAGYRPTFRTQVHTWSTEVNEKMVIREIDPDGSMKLKCTETVNAGTDMTTSTTSWVTTDPYP